MTAAIIVWLADRDHDLVDFVSERLKASHPGVRVYRIPGEAWTGDDLYEHPAYAGQYPPPSAVEGVRQAVEEAREHFTRYGWAS